MVINLKYFFRICCINLLSSVKIKIQNQTGTIKKHALKQKSVGITTIFFSTRLINAYILGCESEK